MLSRAPTSADPLVAIVVPAYQAERHLEASLDSIIGQDYPNWRCIIVDDGSTDATAAIIAEHCGRDGRFLSIRHDNAGVSAARNAGLGGLPSDAAFLCYVDSDDLLLPSAISQLVAGLVRRPDAVAAYGWAELIDGEGRPIEAGRHRRVQSERPVAAGLRTRLLAATEDTSRSSLLLYGTIWPPATAIVRVTAARQVGGFDTTLGCAEDWDFWLRVSGHGPILFVDGQMAWYRRHGVNQTNRTAVCLLAARKVRAKAWATAVGRSERWTVGASGVRVLGWETLLYGRRWREMLLARRPAAAAWCTIRLVLAGVQMLTVRPVVPGLRFFEALVDADRRCGFDPSGDRFEPPG